MSMDYARAARIMHQAHTPKNEPLTDPRTGQTYELVERPARPFTTAEMVAFHEHCPCVHGVGFVEQLPSEDYHA